MKSKTVMMAAGWVLQHLQILLRIAWLLGIGSILMACVPLRPFLPFRGLMRHAASRGKLMNGSSSTKPRWSVPQSYFLHFYLVSVIWTTFLLACISYFAYCTTVPPSSESLGYSSVASHIAGGVDSLSPARSSSSLAKYRLQAWKTVLVLLLMEAQVVRRLYETLYVFDYSPSARMHFLGYLCGLFFYVAAPLSMCSLCCPDVFSYIVTQAINSILRQRAHIADIEFRPLDFGISLLKLGWWQWAGALIFIWGSIHQHRCHKILGLLRTEHQDESTKYFIPYGDWFQIVSCPHYLAEIVIYAGIVVASGGSDLTVWLLFGFVVANLTFAAIETHSWYLCKFDSYPRSRWSIIPYVC
uniref:3-oxo-5-alpha-steroid 4-dehydrogenase C-terminal domain-containing protein n=1 Tax=Araucaria cunninghamii TaxID=56994 RepID=A0A0D6QZ58_ARACU